METKHKIFKPFDKVLVRIRIDAPLIWVCTFYSHLDKDGCHVTIGCQIFDDKDILPYESNKHLVGTADEPDEEVKLEEGEYIMVSDAIYVEECGWILRKFIKTTSHYFFVNDNIPIQQTYAFAIRFKDFNPNDMEETKKHILCVRDGKVIRYKLE